MELPIYFIFSLILAGVCGQISNDLDVDVEDIKKQIGDEIPGVDLSGFDESKIPQADELDAIFRNKCDSKSGNGTYESIKPSKDIFQDCITNFVNFTALREEVEEAKKTGSMDEVFGKYCDKYPEISGCTSDFLEEIEPCLEQNEIQSMNTSLALARKLKDFACHKNGDRIAMFVAEGGVECITGQKEALQECVNSTFGSRVSPDMNPNSLPVILFDTQDCKDFGKFRTCIAQALSHCNTTTPANLMDAFFKYLNRILPCSVAANESLHQNGGSFSISPLTSLILVLSVVIVKLC